MSVSTRAWLFGAGFFLVVLLISAPARLLGYFLPAETLSLQGFEGSLWRGSAASGQVAAGPGKLQLGRVEWDVSVHSLLLLTPRIRFTSQWGGQSVRADVSVSPTGVLRLRDTRVVAPAAMIRHWLPVQLGGEVDLRIPAGARQGSRQTGQTRSSSTRRRPSSDVVPRAKGAFPSPSPMAASSGIETLRTDSSPASCEQLL